MIDAAVGSGSGGDGGKSFAFPEGLNELPSSMQQFGELHSTYG